MSESFYEKAILIVRDGLIRAADQRCLDLFEADQTVLCAKDQVKERLLIGSTYKMNQLLVSQSWVSEKILELRVRKHAFDFGMYLDQERELNDVLVFAVANAISQELDFLIESWSLRQPEEHFDMLFNIAAERQKAALAGEVTSSVA